MWSKMVNFQRYCNLQRFDFLSAFITEKEEILDFESSHIHFNLNVFFLPFLNLWMFQKCWHIMCHKQKKTPTTD